MINSLQEMYPGSFCGEIVSAEDFLKLQIISKETYPENVQKKITIRELEDLRNATCISINDGDGLLCVTEEGDIESVLKKNGAKIDGFLNIAFAMAVGFGGNKLDCYNCAGATPEKGTSLGDSYCKRGFLPVCRIRFNRMMVDSLMAKTYGEPEVIFFIYCGDNVEEYIYKLQGKKYPGINAYKYIPYIDEVQDMLGMNSDDTDYCFALKYRNIINEKWISEYKEKYNGDFNRFAEYLGVIKDKVIDWLGEAEDNHEDTEYPEMSLMNILSSQVDENGDFLDIDGIHMLLNMLGEEGVKIIKEANLPETEYSFYLNKYYHWNMYEPEGLWNDNVVVNNAYRIGNQIYRVNLYDEDDRVVLSAAPVEDEELTKEIYVFNNKTLKNIDFNSMPFLVYKEGLLWFIDKDESNKDRIYSYNPETDKLKVWPVSIMDNVLALFPIHLKTGEFIYFYVKEKDYLGENDFTAIKVGEKDTNLLRIGEIVAINDRYIYSQYGLLGYYRIDMDSMVKKSLEQIGLCEYNVDVVYIDAARDIIYSNIGNDEEIEMPNEEEIERIKKATKDNNYDIYTRGNDKLIEIYEAMNEVLYASNEERIKKYDEILPLPMDVFEGPAVQYRAFGDADLIGINSEGIPVKIWTIPEPVPPIDKYECSFIGEGFKYYERPED